MFAEALVYPFEFLRQRPGTALVWLIVACAFSTLADLALAWADQRVPPNSASAWDYALRSGVHAAIHSAARAGPIAIAMAQALIDLGVRDAARKPNIGDGVRWAAVGSSIALLIASPLSVVTWFAYQGLVAPQGSANLAAVSVLAALANTLLLALLGFVWPQVLVAPREIPRALRLGWTHRWRLFGALIVIQFALTIAYAALYAFGYNSGAYGIGYTVAYQSLGAIGTYYTSALLVCFYARLAPRPEALASVFA